jgi:LAO/AO transport system kinase
VIPAADLLAGVRERDLASLGRAVTLVESRHPVHRAAARDLLAGCAPHAGGAHRVGITGAPGAGKSTLIDALGMHLVQAGHGVAVVAVDPTSGRTGGSILGDRTRMARLSQEPHAFIRPSPSADTLGGVARATRDVITVVEAAGFDVVLVETVGVGQSEIAVAGLVDAVLLLCLGNAGDDLQGIKRGIMEIADVVAVTKADGDTAPMARRAARDLTSALALLHGAGRVPVLTCSALENTGMGELWDELERRHGAAVTDGSLDRRRRAQLADALRTAVTDALLETLHATNGVRTLAANFEREVTAGALPVTVAADRLVAEVIRTYIRAGQLRGG